MNFLEKAGLLMFISGFSVIMTLASINDGLAEFSVGGAVAIIHLLIGGVLFLTGRNK